MANVRVYLKVVKGVRTEQMKEGKVKPVFKYVGTHMIFDIKMDSKFTQKARLVAGGHKTAPPLSTTYFIVVTREGVRMAFIIAGMNDLDTCACDIGNSYLNATCQEKLWTEAGSEFGSENISKRGLTFGRNQLKMKWLTSVSLSRFKWSDTRADERGESKTRI